MKKYLNCRKRFRYYTQGCAAQNDKEFSLFTSELFRKDSVSFCFEHSGDVIGLSLYYPLGGFRKDISVRRSTDNILSFRPSVVRDRTVYK